MFLSIILGLLGMCLVVMALFYLVTMILSSNNNNDSSDMEYLMQEEDENAGEGNTKEEQIYTIDNSNPVKYLGRYLTYNQPVEFCPLD